MMSSEIKYGIKNKNIFCNNPMKYVLVKDLIKEYDFKKIFVETAKNILKNNIYRNQPLLINGQQSSGNLFDLQNNVIKKIKNIILLEVEKYRKQFKINTTKS